ncbi:hypothetical protein SAMN05216490_4253 [Mucilaginibacter mallensis]|uniref:DUF1700 domain-containing protein n=1 Tax=Mucilaginibacter mallensis TaxID=652787 RepID=A0A1H2BPF9_MUCMA|nr:hypothetical protein [Mucilaginibacter mallensis]SDT60083.1 hypothetical protein SAMN05216490_4253 [Mucilaginibacter mallensis]
MKRIIFNNPTAQRIYDDYFVRVNRCISILSAEDQRELLMEFNSHIYEATHTATPENEVDVLMDTLDKLGAPEVVLQPTVAHKKVRQAARSFNPKHVIQAIYLNIFNGLGYFILGLIYLLILAFGSLAIIKLVAPDHTGFFVKDGHYFVFGYTSNLPSGTTEVLGDWFISTVIILMCMFYFFNTLLFRLLKGK